MDLLPSSSSFANRNHDVHENSDDDCYYEDLPPKQIWMTTKNSSSTASSVVSPLPDRQPSPVNNNNNNNKHKTKKFNHKNLIASGHVWMGGMKLHQDASSSTNHSASGDGSTPLLCTPDSTQTGSNNDDDDDDCQEETTTDGVSAARPVVLGIGAAPFYGGRQGFAAVSSSGSHSSISNDQSSSASGHLEEPYSDDDLSGGSIPSFSTRRIILDLQDELARTKAELALFKNNNQKEEQDGNKNTSINTDHHHPIASIKSGSSASPIKVSPPAMGGGRDDSSDIAVVPAVVATTTPKKKFNTIVTSPQRRSTSSSAKEIDATAVAVLQVHLDRSEHRANKLSAKLKETNDLARRLHGTLQRVKDRMQTELLLPYEYHAADVRFMNRCATLLLLALFIIAPVCLLYPTVLANYGNDDDEYCDVDGTTHPDLAAFALVVAVTFCAVEIAVRP